MTGPSGEDASAATIAVLIYTYGASGFELIWSNIPGTQVSNLSGSTATAIFPAGTFTPLAGIAIDYCVSPLPSPGPLEGFADFNLEAADSEGGASLTLSVYSFVMVKYTFTEVVSVPLV